MNPSLVLLTGPPFGPPLLRAVQERLGADPADSVLDAASPAHGWKERAAVLAARIRARPTVVIAHGLAVPVAVAAAIEAPPRALVLSNGPITRLDPITAALGRLARAPGGRLVLERGLLHPALFVRALASSAGLRRAVVNPYVMDRDTVAALCTEVVASAADRRAVASYLASLLDGLPDARALRCPTLLLWGAGDVLYPPSEADFVEANVPTAKHVAVPGGRFGHPEERPWAMADLTQAWLSDQGVWRATTTGMS